MGPGGDTNKSKSKGLLRLTTKTHTHRDTPLPKLRGEEKGEEMEAEEAAAKRARAEDGETVTPEVVSNGISAVMPGWFSEISPMWPGTFSFHYYLLAAALDEICRKILSFVHLILVLWTIVWINVGRMM